VAKSKVEVVTEDSTEAQLAGAEKEFLITLPDGRLYGRTKNYDIFVLFPENRAIDRSPGGALDKLVKANLLTDLLPEYPIVACDIGGKWFVADGQHRREAARINGRFLYYTVSDKMTIADVAKANSTQKKWTIDDYLHHWAAGGREEYRKLQAFISRHPWLKTNTAKDLTSYGDRKKQGFQEGEFRANDLEFAEEVAHFCESLAGLIDWWGETILVYAIAMCYEHEGFEPQRMLRKMRLNQASLHKCVDVEQYMLLFDRIYNHQQRAGSQLHLEKLNSNSPRRREDRRYRRQREEA
jgi:hypothetical protein